MFQPFGNTTVLPPAEWHPEPQTRGTFSILSSCLITMTLCIWTSLHLNVPEHGKASRQKYRQLGWMILGLLAPELVVWNAWEQRKKVKSLSSWMQEGGFMAKQPTSQHQADPEDSEPQQDYDGRVHAWTDVHSWLVVMGGMVFQDTAPKNRRFMPKGRRRIPLTVEDFMWMMEYNRHLIPNVSRAAIEDKSKSDQLGKLLTCWQAVFFCVQCIFRMSERLSITLLELNVSVHAICALILILIWWDKPRDVREPTLVEGEEALDICAYLLALDKLPVHNREGHVVQRPVEPRGILPWDLAFCAVPCPKQFVECLEVDPDTGFHTILPDVNETSSRYYVSEHEKQHEFLKVRDTYWEIQWDDSVNPSMVQGRDIELRLRRCDMELLVRAYRYISHDPRIRSSLQPFFNAHLASAMDWNLEYWDTVHLMALPSPIHLCRPGVGWLAAGLTLAGAFYGGLHLVAWGSVFPSHVETILWRAASVTILSTGPLCAVIALCGSTLMYFFDENKGSESRMLVAFLPFIVLVLSFLLWYILCRAFIIVECFILLAHIPDSALHMPTWSTYIPHIV